MTEQNRSEDAGGSTRERLLDAAIHIAGTEGEGRVTYRSVAARVGVSHGLVRFHFGTREAMLTQALEAAAHRDADESHMLTDDIDVFSHNLAEVLEHGQQRHLLQFDYLLRAVRGGAPLEHVRSLYDFYIEQVAGTFDRVGIEDPDGRWSALVFGALDGLVLQNSIYETPGRTDAVIDAIHDLMRMLQARSA